MSKETEQPEKAVLTVEWHDDQQRIILTNRNGDTYTSKSDELKDFLHDAVSPQPVEGDLREAEKFLLTYLGGNKNVSTLTWDHWVECLHDYARPLPTVKAGNCFLDVLEEKRQSVGRIPDTVTNFRLKRDLLEHLEELINSFNQLCASQSHLPVRETEWIEVSKELPEIGQEVWLFTDYGDNGAIEIAVWTKEIERWYDMNGITHWMPANKPQPPITKS